MYDFGGRHRKQRKIHQKSPGPDRLRQKSRKSGFFKEQQG